MANLSLKNVPFFSRPITAREDDRIVGYIDGDTNQPLYQDRFGNQYGINLLEDQRHWKQKFKEETLPVIKDWIKNPTAPSMDQIKEMGKAIASSVYETASIPGDLLTGKKSAFDVTYQDVADIATGVGTASATFKAPEGALRVFGGATAKSTKNLKEAQSFLQNEMKKINPENPDQFYWANYRTWKKTGWYIDPEDKQWRFEIDDSASKPTLQNLGMTTHELLEQTSLGKSNNVETNLSQIFKHDKLYKQYPHLKDMKVVLYYDAVAKEAGYHVPGSNTIGINLYAHRYDLVEKKQFQGGIDNDISQTMIARTILHEVQHAVQEFEGFTKGANEDFIPRELLSKMDDKLMAKWDKANVSARKSKVTIGEIITNLPKIPNNNIANLAKIIRETDFSGKTGQIKKDQIFQKIVDRYNLSEDSASYKNIKKEMDNIQNKNNEMAGYDQGRLRAATEFYMGAGGEIESRMTEGRYFMRESDRMESFPVKEREEMLQYEGRGNKPGFRGKEGVDPTQPRRVFEGKGIGQADIIVDLSWRDFRIPRLPDGRIDSKGVKTGWKKLQDFFKGDEKLEFLFDKNNVGKKFTHNGEEFILKDITLREVDKVDLPKDKGIFHIDPTTKQKGGYLLGEKRVAVPHIAVNKVGKKAMDGSDNIPSLNFNDQIPLHEFVEDTQKYIGNKIKNPSDNDSIIGVIRKTFGFAEGGAVDKQMDELFAGSI
tara:strand:- start:139 stop:2277 length:2139 start_codon:yes stop_codon:yes gene_type:complete